MKKMSTLFFIDYQAKGLPGAIRNEVRPENAWVYSGVPFEASRKWDGAACAVIGGELYKRYDAKHGKNPPIGAIPCCEPDSITGHWPHWLKVTNDDKSNKYLLETWNSLQHPLADGTYEFCGEKIKANPEKILGHVFMAHGKDLVTLPAYDFASIKSFLSKTNIEGLVLKNLNTGEMCKIRKTDFGFNREDSQ